MLWLAAAIAAGWATSVLVLVGALDRQRRAHDRRIDLLIARVAHLADKPLPQDKPFRPPALVGPPELIDPDQWPEDEL